MQSPKYKLTSEDAKKIGQAFAFSLASASIAFFIMVVEQIDFAEYAFIVPIINAVLYGAKRFVEER